MISVGSVSRRQTGGGAGGVLSLCMPAVETVVVACCVVSGDARGLGAVSVRIATAGNMSSALASESSKCETLSFATMRPCQMSKANDFRLLVNRVGCSEL